MLSNPCDVSIQILSIRYCTSRYGMVRYGTVLLKMHFELISFIITPGKKIFIKSWFTAGDHRGVADGQVQPLGGVTRAGTGEGGPADGQPDPQRYGGPRVWTGNNPHRHMFRCRGGEGGQAVLDPLPGQVSFPSGQVPTLASFLPVNLLGRSGHW